MSSSTLEGDIVKPDVAKFYFDRGNLLYQSTQCQAAIGADIEKIESFVADYQMHQC